ncbi:MAG: hypothetical protein AAGF76_00705 [Pseudomonadota bacterium]
MAEDEIERSNRLADDAERLLFYASENGLLTGETPEDSARLQDGLVSPLLAAIASHRQKPGLVTTDLVVLHSALRQLTGAVSGQSIRDTLGASDRGKTLILATVSILFLAITMLVSATSETFFTRLLSSEACTILSVAAWGAFGSCVFLLKRFHDLVRGMVYDRRLFQGSSVRITLGAGLAIAIYLLVANPQNQENSGTLAPFEVYWSAYALLIGLGTKVFYGLLESSIDALADRFRLNFQARMERETAPPTLPPSDPQAPVVAAPGQAAWGATREEVIEIQRLLKELDRFPGEPDGQLSAVTLAALATALDFETEEEIFQRRPGEIIAALRVLGAGGEAVPTQPLSEDERGMALALYEVGAIGSAPEMLSPPAMRIIISAAIASLPEGQRAEFDEMDPDELTKKIRSKGFDFPKQPAAG